MDRWKNRVAVVTGASSGIGAVLVEDLIRAGLIVIGLARRVDRIEVIRQQLPDELQQRFHSKFCDVSREESIQNAFDWIESTFGGIDILINNAGRYQHGYLSNMENASILEVVNTNLLGLVYCTQRAFRSMRERGFDGHVVHINSILGHQVHRFEGSSANIYSATKYAVTALTEVYRQEFAGLGTKVKVTSISPGLVDTEIVREPVKKLMADCILNAKDISDAVLYVLGTPPHVQIHELVIKPIGEKV